MVDVLLWYLWAQAFALGGSLIASRLLQNLPDRGYAVGKALGILFGGFAYWMFVTLGFSQNNTGAALLALVAVWVAGIGLQVTSDVSRLPFEELKPQTSNVIFTEFLFLVGFLSWAVVRAYSPNIEYAGGEKFMESMMINAILRSPTFPPNDAWLSGFSISYYYFGYIMFAMLIQVSGVAPSIAFNLGGAMIFALTLTSAYGVGVNVWRRNDELRMQSAENPVRHSLFAGLLTALMLALMGNLGGLMGALKCANALPQGVWQWLDIRDTATQVYDCRGLAPSSFYGWWWDWSRVIKDTSPAGGVQEVITEAPIFSFVLGDNHPHVMALPFVMLALALALNAFNDTKRETQVDRQTSTVKALPSLVLSAIVFGGLAFMNTWDFPIYGTIYVACLLLGRWLRRESLLPVLISGVATIALSYLIYIPFYATFSSQARGITVNVFNGTRLPQFFMMFAPFLMAALGYLVLLARESQLPTVRLAVRTSALAVGIVIVILLGAVAMGLLSSETRVLAQELMNSGQLLGVTREQANTRLLERAANPWLILSLSAGIALCALLVLSIRRATADRNTIATDSPQATVLIPPRLPSPDIFVLLLFTVGGLLTLAVEFVYLRDLFGTRMNTVFKFYYIAWAVWSVAGAYAVMRLVTARGTLAKVMGGISVAVVAMGLLWAVMAIPTRTDNFAGQATLDGAAFLRRSNPGDAAMIDWLNKNVKRDVRIVEASTMGSYSYEGRISAFTGLPTALGWGGHQHQWRGDITQAALRQPIVEQLYKTPDILEARTLLNQLDARYVILGDTERGLYAGEGLDKFETMCRTAFEQGNSVIYDCM
jgi:YYY domain-containing protein